ncbi:MAG: T9SS C-terminal target domain-containing protein [Bacteroidetes bacterium]|nr:MAG: T9SS C-terminal target domain-containing protein [Bacteroidota bacterium]
MMKNHIFFAFIFMILAQAANAQGLPSNMEAKIDQVQSQFGLSGKGVLTIMMDRGIDYRHPDFIDANGKTRIAYIYDLYENSGANDPDNPFGVGTIYDSTEINASLQNGGTPLTNDLFGHGTATTGIMAGNGSGVSSGTSFRGVAYQAKIISIIVTKDFVPASGNNPGQQAAYNPSLLTYAFQFATLKAAELNMPTVTLLNIGSIQDPTDGSIALCNLIDGYVASGHTFVCGVGDDGGKDNHAISTLVQNQPTEFVIQKGEAGNLRFSAWYAESDRVEVSIQRPNGQVEGPFASPAGPTSAVDNQLNQIHVYHRGAEVEFANSSSDLRQILIDFFGENGTYTITLTPTVVASDGRIDAFLNPALFYNNNGFLNNTHPGGNINSFSACPSVISPGDYVATNTWTDVNGVSRIKTNEGAPGERWVGSATGPTMDGRLGIDLVAPGEIAWAAYGADSYYASFDFNILENSQRYYGIQTAVSAAAPIVAGVIALMLEVNPALTPEEIKTILHETSTQDNFTGSTPNEQWGYGKLDALAAINRTFQTVSRDEVAAGKMDISIIPNPANDFVEIAYSALLPKRLPLSLYSMDGRKIKALMVASGEKLDLRELPTGVYLLHAHIGGMVLTKKIIKK